MLRKTIPTLAVLAALAAAAQAQGPSAEIILGERKATARPHQAGYAHAGGGNIHVSQPAPDTVVITMTGVAVAGGHPCKASAASYQFDLNQCFKVVLEGKVQNPRLALQGRVVGLLRSGSKHCKEGGFAEVSAPGQAVIHCGEATLLSLHVGEARSVAACQNISINDHAGPVAAPLAPGKYVLHQTFGIAASHERSLKFPKAASAEFAPAPALDPKWISRFEPFHGANKSEFGFQIVIKIVTD